MRGLLPESRRRSPLDIGREQSGFLGVVTRGVTSAKTLRFQIKSAQAKQLRFRIIEHRLEFGSRILRAAFQHGCLRIEQLDQWLLIDIQQLLGLANHPSCCLAVTGTGSDQTCR